MDQYSQILKLGIEKGFIEQKYFWECFLDYCKLDRILVEETLLQLLPENKKQDYYEIKMKRLYNK